MSDFRYDQEKMIELALQATSHEERIEVMTLWDEAIKLQQLVALGDLRRNSVAMLEVVGRMIGHIDLLSRSPGLSGRKEIGEMREEVARLHSVLHDNGRDPVPIDTATPDPGSDAEDIDDATTPPVSPDVILGVQNPINSRRYSELADEYVRFFNGAGIRSSHAAKVKKMANIAFENRARYQSIGTPLGIPWWFIAGLHQMESTYNFRRHLHNGDSLNGRTVRVPAGRPVSGSPPFTFEESATDALRQKGFDTETDWSLPRALYRFERYNGFGYRPRGVPTPYLWGFTSIYARGKYVADGVFDANAVTQQCGVGALLRQLANDGRINPISNQFADVDAPGSVDDGVDQINEDDTAAPSHPFEAFWNANLSHIEHFNWREFLFKGASNSVHRNNTDPPEDKYQNIVQLAGVLDKIRTQIGGRISLISVYRSPAYNSAIGGASSSRHMEFDAADFKVIDSGHGNANDWAAVAKQLRSAGEFEGGIGVYSSFVHVDTRGHRANWTG